MHLKSLHIQNFRSLEDFKVSKLGRINLIVGKNNSGKSSVLEALRIYAANAHPTVLDLIAASHNEPSLLDEPGIFDSLTEKPFEDFFTGRKYPSQDEKYISIGELDDISSTLTINHYLMNRTQEITREGIEETTKTNVKRISKENTKEKPIYNLETLHVSKDSFNGFVDLNGNISTIQKMVFDIAKTTPCSYIPTQFISMEELAGIWDEVQFSEHGNFVKEGLKFIDEGFENIAFVANKNEGTGIISSLANSALARKFGMKRTAIVKLKNQTKAIPLNSMGDGMVRVLQLLLKVYPAKGGFLLIDEFENGLHYSVQEKIWQFLFDLAEKLDIQVFATTHNWDCIESFAKVAVENTQSEGVLFRVGRSVRNSDQGKVIATVLDEEQLLNITQTDVEVR